MFSVVIAETISICNRRCWYCKYGHIATRKKKDSDIEIMGWDVIVNIIKNLALLNFSGRLSWQRINEPLLDERLPDIIRLSREKLPLVYLSISTNGDLLNQKISDLLFASGLDHLTVTAYEDEVFAKYYELSFPSSNLKDRRGHFEGWDNRGGNIPGMNKGNANSSCMRPSTAVNIVPSGKVVLCCADFYEDVFFGNIKKSSLEAIWKSSEYSNYRMTLQKGRLGLPLCEKCNYDGRGHGVHGNM